MLVIIPSFLISIIFYDLGAILEFCGTFTLFLSGISIPAISMAAQHMIPEKSDYDFKYNYLSALSLLMSSFLVLFACLINTIMQYL